MALTREKIKKAYGKNMSIVEKAERVIRSPTAFFNAVKEEKGAKNAFIYLAIISAVSSVLNYYFNPFSSLMFTMFGQFGLAIIAVMWLFTILFSFVIYGFFHLFVLLLGGKQGYHNTYKAFAYGFTPAALLGWIPFLFMRSFNISGLIVMFLLLLIIHIWSFYITIKGISILQKMSMLHALGVILLPVLIIILVIMLLAGLFIFTVLSLAERGGNFPDSYSGFNYNHNPMNLTESGAQPPQEKITVNFGTAPPDVLYIYIVNAGNTVLDTSKISVFIDEQRVACSWDSTSTIFPGDFRTCKTHYVCSESTLITAAGPNSSGSTGCNAP